MRRRVSFKLEEMTNLSSTQRTFSWNSCPQVNNIHRHFRACLNSTFCINSIFDEKKKYTFCNPMQKFRFSYSQVFVMNFSCDSGWHYISPNFTSHKIHGHKHSSQLRETRIIIRKLVVPIPILKRQKKGF